MNERRPDFGDGLATGIFATGIALLLILMLLGAFRPWGYLNNSYCTDFAPTFQLNADGTWECVGDPR